MVISLIKRVINCILALIIPLMLLAGCFLYDEQVGDNIGLFVDPENNPTGDFLPEENASKTIEIQIAEDPVTPDIEVDYGVIIYDENHIRLTKPPIFEVNENNMIVYYYEGDKFRFTVPFLWRKTMVVDVETETDEDGYELTFYTFSYVPEAQIYDPPQEAKVMVIRVASYDYFLRKGHGADGVVATEEVKREDGLVYTLMKPSEDYQLSMDFPDIDGYINIQMVLTNNWNFKHIDRSESG